MVDDYDLPLSILGLNDLLFINYYSFFTLHYSLFVISYYLLVITLSPVFSF